MGVTFRAMVVVAGVIGEKGRILGLDHKESKCGV